MINLYVDEAYAFDYLSILEIKKKNSDNDMLNYSSCERLITNQIGAELFDSIKTSVQYSKLVETNQLVYNQIERIRNGEKLDAKEVDDANMLRFKYKKDLQSHFFNTKLAEQKTKEV